MGLVPRLRSECSHLFLESHEGLLQGAGTLLRCKHARLRLGNAHVQHDVVAEQDHDLSGAVIQQLIGNLRLLTIGDSG